MSEYLQNLKEAVTAMHGCDCFHVSTSKVVEAMDGKVIWQGDVETFGLKGHESATQAFAWAWQGDGEPNYIAVLNVAPINDPSDAVRAAISSGTFS